MFWNQDISKDNFWKEYYLVFETLADFKEKNLGFIIKCFNEENLNFQTFETISKEGELILNNYYELNNISKEDTNIEEVKVCIGFVSGAMIYILSLKELNMENNL